MTQVVDYSWARPGGANIKKAGYLGVMRYLSYDTTGKTIVPAEMAELKAAGLEVGLVWESTANRVAGGAANGILDAHESSKQANALGYTGPIYFAIDYDAPESDQPAINAYFQGVAVVIGHERTGGYGGYGPIKRLFDAGLIAVGWQTLAWSGGNREARCSLYQNGAQAFDNSADVNDVLKDNWNGSNQQEDEVITKDDTDRVRIINSEVQGPPDYPFNDTHSGKFDAKEMAAWVGQPWTKFIDQKWKQGEAFRNKRTAALYCLDYERPQLQKQVSDLTAENEKLKTQLVVPNPSSDPQGFVAWLKSILGIK